MGCTSSHAADPSSASARISRKFKTSAERELEGLDDSVRQDLALLNSLADKTLLMSMNKASPMGRKCSAGSSYDIGRTSFQNKSSWRVGTEQDPEAGVGFTCRKGLKAECPNQDSWLAVQLQEKSLFGVFDGHGQRGHECSHFVQQNMAKLILEDPRLHTRDLPELLEETFMTTQRLLSSAHATKQIRAAMSGTTATVCVYDHLEQKLSLAHVADSTCVLGKRTPYGVRGVPLTRDHRPELDQERERIEANGGRVLFDGYANYRVYAKGARFPGLNMSRSLGDVLGHDRCGLSCAPELREVQLESDDAVLLLCSDGVWEFISHTRACEIVMEFPKHQAMDAANKLAKEAWDAWIQEEGGASVDDITVVVVYLDPSSASTTKSCQPSEATTAAINVEDDIADDSTEGGRSTPQPTCLQGTVTMGSCFTKAPSSEWGSDYFGAAGTISADDLDDLCPHEGQHSFETQGSKSA